MDLISFCIRLKELFLTQKEYALSIIWFHDEKTPEYSITSGAVSRIMYECGLGNPNSTQLGEQLKKSGFLIVSTKGFRLKALSRLKIQDWLQPILGEVLPVSNQELGYLPQDVWKETRDYIERVCVQLNGCFQFQFYDGAAVLMRRLIETLIIESYELSA